MADSFDTGEMAERSNAAVLKTVEPLRVPGVRIPLSPLKKKKGCLKRYSPSFLNVIFLILF